MTFFKLKKAEEYSPDKTYLQEKYVNVKVIPSTKKAAEIGDNTSFWIRLDNTEEYIYIRSSNTGFEKLSGDKPVTIKGKIHLAQDEKINNSVLCGPVLNTTYSNLNGHQKDFLDSISNCNLYINMIDEDILNNKIFYSLMCTLILSAVYIVLSIILKPDKKIL